MCVCACVCVCVGGLGRAHLRVRGVPTTRVCVVPGAQAIALKIADPVRVAHRDGMQQRTAMGVAQVRVGAAHLDLGVGKDRYGLDRGVNG